MGDMARIIKVAFTMASFNGQAFAGGNGFLEKQHQNKTQDQISRKLEGDGTWTLNGDQGPWCDSSLVPAWGRSKLVSGATGTSVGITVRVGTRRMGFGSSGTRVWSTTIAVVCLAMLAMGLRIGSNWPTTARIQTHGWRGNATSHGRSVPMVGTSRILSHALIRAIASSRVAIFIKTTTTLLRGFAGPWVMFVLTKMM